MLWRAIEDFRGRNEALAEVVGFHLNREADASTVNHLLVGPDFSSDEWKRCCCGEEFVVVN